MMTDYHEYSQDRLPPETLIVKKPRRGRKERVRLNGEKSVTTSSSGAQFESYTGYCDYNSNQLRAQYSNTIVEENSHEVKRKEGKHKQSIYECMGDMVVDPVPSDEEMNDGSLDENSSNIDPEDLRPYSNQDNVFPSNAMFEYRNFPNIQRAKNEETKDRLPAFIQSKPPIKINVQLPESYANEEQPRNDLMSENQPYNQVFKIKQEIKHLGLQNGSFKESLQFVKMLSAPMDIDTFVKETQSSLVKRSQAKTGNSKQQIKLEDLRYCLCKEFFKKLSSVCTESIFAELMEQTNNKQSTNTAKGTKQQQTKVEEVQVKQTKPAPVKQPEPTNNQQPAVQEKKKKKNKKNKKKKKTDGAVAEELCATPPKPKEKLSDVASETKRSSEICDQDSIQQIAADLCKYTDTASGPEGDKGLGESFNESVTSSCIDRIQRINQEDKNQQDMLLSLQQKLEHIFTAEKMIDGHCEPDDCMRVLKGTGAINQVEDFTDSDDNNSEAIQRMLNALPPQQTFSFRATESELRYKEERTGLLSNQVHLDKYTRETMHELEQIKNRRLSPSFQSSEMLDYVLARNRAENTRIKDLRDTAETTEETKKHINKLKMYDGTFGPSRETQPDKERRKWQKSESPRADSESMDEDEKKQMAEIMKYHYELLKNEKPLPRFMSRKQKDIVLKILQDQYKQQLKQKEHQEQSGSGPAEDSKKKAPEVQDAKQDESKKKVKKKTKKNRRQNPKVIAIDTKPQSTAKAVSSDLLKQTIAVAETTDDVEEVILPEDSTHVAREVDVSVLRNNFLTEEPPKSKTTVAESTVTILDAVVHESLDQVDKEEQFDREDYVQTITSKLIQNAVQNCTEQAIPAQPKQTKSKRQKGKGKHQQEVQQFQQKVKQPEKSRVSQLSSDAASTGGKGVPVYCGTPILNMEERKPASVVSFKADLSDNVKIPKRGTSQSSYGKEEKFHEQTLLELDSLFPSAKKQSSSGSSLKVRSSTLSKERKSVSKNSVALFEKTARLSNLNANYQTMHDDVQSQKVQKSKPAEADIAANEPSSPLQVEFTKERLNKGEAKEDVTQGGLQDKSISKKQRKKRQKQLLMEELVRASQTKEAVIEEKPVQQEVVIEEQPVKQPEPEITAKQATNQRKDIGAKQGKTTHKETKSGPQYQPKAQTTIQQQQQKTNTKNQGSTNKETEVQAKPVIAQKTETIKPAEMKNETKAEIRPITDNKKLANNPETVRKDSTKPGALKSQTFESIDQMFEQVYGPQAISAVPTKAVEKPVDTTVKAVEQAKTIAPKKPAKNATSESKPDSAAKQETVETEPDASPAPSKDKKPADSAEDKKGRGIQANIKSTTEVQKTKPIEVMHSEKPASFFHEKSVDQTKQQKSTKFVEQKQQYSVSSFQTPPAHSNFFGQAQTSTFSSYKAQQVVQQTNYSQETYSKRNRGVQFPLSTLGNSVTQSTPTTQSNSSQTLNQQHISTQQQHTQYTLNFNIVNTTNQFVAPAMPAQQTQYMVPQQQQLYQQQHMQYMQMLAQQQQFMAGQGPMPMQFVQPMMMPQYQGYGGQIGMNQPIANQQMHLQEQQTKKPDGPKITDDYTGPNQSKADITSKELQQQSLQQNQNITQMNGAFKTQDTAASTPRIFSPQPYNSQMQYTRPPHMVSLSHPYYAQQKPNYMQQYPASYPAFVYQQPVPMQVRSFFNYSEVQTKMVCETVRANNLNLVFCSNEVREAMDKFYAALGKYVVKVQSKIETRLANIEELKDATYSRIQQIAKQTFNDPLDFEIYGSQSTKLAIDTSDMDIAVYGVLPATKLAASLNPRELVVNAMDLLSLRFDTIDWIKNNRVIGTASVPVIKLEIDLEKLAKTVKTADKNKAQPDVKTLKIDIIFNDIALSKSRDDTDVIEECQTKKAAEYVKAQIVQHPFLKPLVVVLKKYLSMRNLNNSFMGTVSSYGLVLMIIALLEDMKQQDPALERVTGELLEINLGKALTNFFYVYSSFDTQNCMINQKNEFTQPEDTIGQLNTNGTYILQIIDPCNDANNVGKQTYRFEEVQESLLVTFECLVVRSSEYFGLYQPLLELKRRNEDIKFALNSFNSNAKDETHSKEAQTSLFEDYNDLGESSSQAVVFWSRHNASYMQELKKRGQNQLLQDQKQGKEITEKIKKEFQTNLAPLIDKVLMINSEDLTQLSADTVEEQQKIMIQLKKLQLPSLFAQSSYDQGSQDIQDLLTGQHTLIHPPHHMYQPTPPGYQGIPYYQGYGQYQGQQFGQPPPQHYFQQTSSFGQDHMPASQINPSAQPSQPFSQPSGLYQPKAVNSQQHQIKAVQPQQEQAADSSSKTNQRKKTK